MIEDVDVVIVGAGFAGLAAARVCLGAGLRVVVLERRAGLEREGAGISVQPVGLAALDRLGLLEAARSISTPFTVVEQCDANGCVRVRFDYAALRHPHPFMMTVERAQLIACLGDGVPVRFGAAVTGLKRGDAGRVAGVAFRDADGEDVLHSTWVVGADGRGSAVRQAAGIRSRLRTGPERYVVGLVHGEALRDVGRLYCGPGWADGVLPHPGRRYFFDFVNEENRAAVDRRDFDAWATIFRARIPDAAAVLENVRSFSDLSVLTGRPHMALPRVRRGVALAGDAAASVHPHTGQGANFALDDGWALGTALATGRAEAIRAYGRRHDARAARYVPYSVLAGRILDAGGPGRLRARTATMHINRLPAARRLALTQQTGLR